MKDPRLDRSKALEGRKPRRASGRGVRGNPSVARNGLVGGVTLRSSRSHRNGVGSVHGAQGVEEAVGLPAVETTSELREDPGHRARARASVKPGGRGDVHRTSGTVVENCKGAGGLERGTATPARIKAL
jgi:hypothetical protein